VPRLETLRLSWFDAPDLEGQQKIAAEIQQVVFEEAPYLPLGQYFFSTAWRKTITEPISAVNVFWGVKRA
jgi:peptide/nickel transport system substrate-binding protein